jgi:hypothetical protein
MRTLDQSERIDQFLTGEEPPAVRLRLDFRSDGSAESVLRRTCACHTVTRLAKA